MALPVGAHAPDVALSYRPKEFVRLADFHREGPVLVLFFPLAFSSTCTEEVCTVAEDYSAYRDIGASVVGVSIDSPYTNQRFADACGATFPVLSDFNKEAAVAFDVLRDEVNGLKGVSERAAFVIDRGGVIRYAWVGENLGLLPPFAEIKEAIRAATG